MGRDFKGLASVLVASNEMRIVRSLLGCPQGRGVRELSDLAGLSPRGGSIVIDRLAAAGVIQSATAPSKRDVRWALNLENNEIEFLVALFEQASCEAVKRRALDLTKSTAETVSWLDRGYRQLSQVKSRACRN